MAFTNTLIISDNLFLCKELKKILISKSYNNRRFTFSTSPFSDHLFFLNELSCDVVSLDLKNIEDINFIIKHYDLVISIHCKQIFPNQLVKNVRCINIHPGYNPINRGWYPQVFAIIKNLPIGATIHEIDEELDHGAIIAQEFVDYDFSDTSLTIYNRILNKEIELFVKYIDIILEDNYQTIALKEEGNLHLKKDFNSLCEINLEEIATYREVINRLRALSHGEFKNAYFFDPETNEKIYISVELKKDAKS